MTGKMSLSSTRGSRVTAAGWFWILSYASFVILGWVTPNDVFELYPKLKAFADPLAQIVPQIERMSELGGVRAGQANRFVYSAIWAASPIYFLVLKFQSDAYIRQHGYEKKLNSAWEAVGLLIACMLLLFQAIYVDADPQSRLVRGTLVNHFFRAIWAPLLGFAPALAVLGFWTILRGMATNEIYKKRT